MSTIPLPPPDRPRRDEMESPVDLPGAATIGGRPLAWTATAIATAALFLLVTNAITLDGWAAELAPSETVARLNAVTAGWRDGTDGAGLGTPRAMLHAQWRKAQAARFPGQAAGEGE